MRNSCARPFTIRSGGYYTRGETQRFPDYYTTVDVHPIFGRLLARQLEEIWRMLGRPEVFVIAEAAAGTGRLASHILDFAARELSDFYATLQYITVESSEARRAAQAQTLAIHIARGRVILSAEMPQTIAAGCILSNELLDALPVHRVMMVRGVLREAYVALKDGALVEEFGAPSTTEIELYFREQGIKLAEGQQAEAGLEAGRWIKEAARTLTRGVALTIDYGYEAAELYNERRIRGTLLAYSEHRVSEDLLRAPGEQDLTAHVNFTAVDLWGRRKGLQRTGSVSQMAFLVAMGRANEFADLYDPGATETDRIHARLALKTLIHPEGMGETFQVFVQHKGMDAPQLTGLAGI